MTMWMCSGKQSRYIGLGCAVKAAEEDHYLFTHLMTTVFLEQPLEKPVGLLKLRLKGPITQYYVNFYLGKYFCFAIQIYFIAKN